MQDHPHDPETFLAGLPHDSRAVAFAAAFFVFLTAGFSPRMTW